MEKHTEDLIIINHTRRWFSESSWDKTRFAKEKVLPALVSDGLYDPEPVLADDFQKWQDNRRRVIVKVIDGTGVFPFKWKWVWINCLPLEYRESCLRDLLALHGTLYIPLPETTDSRMPAESRIYNLTKEFSDVQMASRPAQDGSYDVRDDINETQYLADQLLELIEAAHCELRRIEMGTGIVPTRITINRTILNKHEH